MKSKYINIHLLSFLILLCFTLLAKAQKSEQIIELDVNMIIDESEETESYKLFDEQDNTGDPLNSAGANPTYFWNTGTLITYPVSAILDLQSPFIISKVFLRDTYNDGLFNIYYGAPDNWKLLLSDPMKGYMSWNQHDTDVKSRFLKFEKASSGANVAEVVLYGEESSYQIYEAVQDLTSQRITTKSVLLAWTLPTGGEFPIKDYDIRVSHTPIDEDSFEDCAQVSAVSFTVDTTKNKVSCVLNDITVDDEKYIALKTIDTYTLTSPVSNCAENDNSTLENSVQQIALSTDMILNEHAQGDASLLVDEQTICGIETLDKLAEPDTYWRPSTSDWMYPCYVLIDLKGLCKISSINIYQKSAKITGDSAFSVFYGEPFKWEQLALFPHTDESQWVSLDEEELVTRYIRIGSYSSEQKLSEVAIFGTRVEAVEEIPVTKSQKQTTTPFGNYLGINSFASDPIGLQEAATFVREYHDWQWCDGNAKDNYPGYPDNRLEFNTMGVDFDAYYRNLKNLDMGVVPCIQHGVPYLVDNDAMRLQDHPVPTGADTEDPASYVAHADFMYQYAARYGTVNVDESKLKLEDGQSVLSGLGLVKYYENYNEHDKWWQGKDAFFTPYQYMAMTSADYDGHQGTMGNTVGIKNADPDAKLVMSGLAKAHLDYIKAMKLWADYNRDGDLPFDVINIHHYCSDNKTGISPEEGGLKELLTEFVEYRDRVMPEKELWLTEFGYDTNDGSIQQAPPIANYSSEEVQAMWLVRSMLEISAAGIDRAVMYMLRDVSLTSTTLYASAGLVKPKSSDYAKKPAWNYYYTLKSSFSDMVFEEEVPTGQTNVKVYRFKDNGLNVYAVWCPTSNGTTVDNYSLTFQSGETQAQRVELSGTEMLGVKTVLDITNNRLQVEVTENPTFFIAAGSDYTFETEKTEAWYELDPSWISNETDEGDASLMADEQDKVLEPLEGNGGYPENNWRPSYGADYPISAYIDLQEVKEITKILFFDTFGNDDVTISLGEPGNWEVVATEDLNSYNTWKNHIIEQESRYIRISLEGPNANFSEIAVYCK